MGLVGAMFLDAILRGNQGKNFFQDLYLVEAVIGLSAFGNVNSGLASLGRKAKGPA